MAEKRDKGKSPFYPGQPVPPEFFVGRKSQIDRILTRGAGQVADGKPVAMFVQGEYGIGKSSIAVFAQQAAEQAYDLLPIYANMGGAKNLEGMATKVIEATLRSRTSTRGEALRSWLARYIGKQELFGITVDLQKLEADAPQFTTPSQMLSFLRQALERVKGASGSAAVKGVFLVLDELNGIAGNPDFAHFIKGFVEENAVSRPPLPLLLMLCGVEEKRRRMIENHPPIDRIFEIVEIESMTKEEMEAFLSKSFASVDIEVTSEAMDTLTHYAAGFPKIMHVIGDEAYWRDDDGKLDLQDAIESVRLAAEEVGRKYVDQQVYKALRSADYHSILKKIASMPGSFHPTFKKKDIKAGLTPSEQKKLDNFLQKMKRLNVIRASDVAGEYVFVMEIVHLYIWLKSLES